VPAAGAPRYRFCPAARGGRGPRRLLTSTLPPLRGVGSDLCHGFSAGPKPAAGRGEGCASLQRGQTGGCGFAGPGQGARLRAAARAGASAVPDAGRRPPPAEAVWEPGQRGAPVRRALHAARS